LHDHGPVVASPQRGKGAAQVQPEFRRTLPVAGETVLGKNRENVFLKYRSAWAGLRVKGAEGQRYKYFSGQAAHTVFGEFDIKSAPPLAPVTETSEGVSRRPP